MSERWTVQYCDRCDGKGIVVSDWYPGGDECSDCNGSGSIWRSPKGALAKYPGGPFIGRTKSGEKPDAGRNTASAQQRGD